MAGDTFEAVQLIVPHVMAGGYNTLPIYHQK
jgi:hypothetical protein